MEKHEAEQVVGEKIVLFVCVDSNELYRSYYAKTASGKKYRLSVIRDGVRIYRVIEEL